MEVDLRSYIFLNAEVSTLYTFKNKTYREPLPHKNCDKNNPEESNPRFLGTGVLSTV
jgi:hypothetical protein